MVRWLLVQLDKTGRFRIRLVPYRTPLVKFKEGGGVDLSQLALRRPKPPVNRQGRRFGREDCGTVAEQLMACVKLSMNFQSDPETDLRIVLWRLRCLHDRGPLGNLSGDWLKH